MAFEMYYPPAELLLSTEDPLQLLPRWGVRPGVRLPYWTQFAVVLAVRDDGQVELANPFEASSTLVMDITQLRYSMTSATATARLDLSGVKLRAWMADVAAVSPLLLADLAVMDGGLLTYGWPVLLPKLAEAVKAEVSPAAVTRELGVLAKRLPNLAERLSGEEGLLANGVSIVLPLVCKLARHGGTEKAPDFARQLRKEVLARTDLLAGLDKPSVVALLGMLSKREDSVFYSRMAPDKLLYLSGLAGPKTSLIANLYGDASGCVLAEGSSAIANGISAEDLFDSGILQLWFGTSESRCRMYSDWSPVVAWLAQHLPWEKVMQLDLAAEAKPLLDAAKTSHDMTAGLAGTTSPSKGPSRRSVAL